MSSLELRCQKQTILGLLQQSDSIRSKPRPLVLVAVLLLQDLHQLYPCSFKRVSPESQFRLLEHGTAQLEGSVLTMGPRKCSEELRRHGTPSVGRDRGVVEKVSEVARFERFHARGPGDRIGATAFLAAGDCVEVTFVPLQRIHNFDNLIASLVIELIFMV